MVGGIRVTAVLIALFLLGGCASPGQGLWPPSPESPSSTVFVSLDTWHAMIAFPQDETQVTSEAHGKAQAQASSPPFFRFEEWGYAERAWYVEGRQGLIGVLRALFWPTEGAVEVGVHHQVWAERTPQPPADLFIFRISDTGAQRLHRHLRATISERGLISAIGRSRFYSSTRAYDLFHTCHQFAAHALREAGLPVSAFWAFSRASLAMQLERAVRLAGDDNLASARRINHDDK